MNWKDSFHCLQFHNNVFGDDQIYLVSAIKLQAFV